MNTPYRYLLLLLGGLGLLSGALHAQTLNWGSAVFSDLVDSKGNTLGDTFVFEIGSFKDNFIPDDTNTGLWLENWRVFDRAAYNGIETVGDDGIYGYFTSTMTMNGSGVSESAYRTSNSFSFEGLDAYIWIRNSDVVSETAEWMLAREADWVFATPDTDCCGNDLPIEWSTSDLTASNIPVWGSQGGVTGDGKITNTGVYTLQTATFVPEPSSSILALLGLMIALIRRRR